MADDEDIDELLEVSITEANADLDPIRPRMGPQRRWLFLRDWFDIFDVQFVNFEGPDDYNERQEVLQFLNHFSIIWDRMNAITNHPFWGALVHLVQLHLPDQNNINIRNQMYNIYPQFRILMIALTPLIDQWVVNCTQVIPTLNKVAHNPIVNVTQYAAIRVIQRFGPIFYNIRIIELVFEERAQTYINELAPLIPPGPDDAVGRRQSLQEWFEEYNLLFDGVETPPGYFEQFEVVAFLRGYQRVSDQFELIRQMPHWMDLVHAVRDYIQHPNPQPLNAIQMIYHQFVGQHQIVNQAYDQWLHQCVWVIPILNRQENNPNVVLCQRAAIHGMVQLRSILQILNFAQDPLAVPEEMLNMFQAQLNQLLGNQKGA